MIHDVVAKQLLPWEIIDEMLVHLGYVEIAIRLERYSIIQKINRDYNYNWAIAGGEIQVLKYFNARGLVAILTMRISFLVWNAQKKSG